jgi:hypothetical protein
MGKQLRDSRFEKTQRLIWTISLCTGYWLAIVLPYVSAFVVEHVSLQTPVSLEFINVLLSTSGISLVSAH